MTALQVRITLGDDAVEVTGPNLDARPLRLFFRGALGGATIAGGWRVPVRSGDGAELVVRIAARLDKAGLAVETASDRVDVALKHELERVRSFERARRAASALAGLAEGDEAVPDEQGLLATIADFGWNEGERRLLPHQLRGLRHAMTATNAANFSVPGAGKTATALAVIAAHLALDHIDAVVVVGPLSCFRPWERETQVALPGKLDVRRVRGATPAERRRSWREAGAGELLLCTYATAASDRHEIERRLRGGLRIMLIADESHRVKRFKGGQWAPALVSIARLARVRMILTGTPMPQGPLDLWSQFNILWPGEEATGSRASFQARADRDFDGVIRSLEPFFVRTPKAELKLTPPDVRRPEVEFPPVQREVYELIESRMRQAIPDAASWTDKLDALRKARPIRLIQAASNPDLLNAEDGFFDLPPLAMPGSTLMERLYRYRRQGELPAKFAWALEQLEKLKADDQKCVVWTNFIRNIDQFSRLARERLGVPVFSVDGRVPTADGAGPVDELDETREHFIDEFLAHEGCSVLVANPAACAESISLHSRCHTAIYLDRTHDCARWLQSIDRIHRLGLPAGVQVRILLPQTVLYGSSTVDGLVDAALERKRATMQQFLEGAELRAAQAPGQDTLAAAEGSDEDLDALLRYLLGEA